MKSKVTRCLCRGLEMRGEESGVNRGQIEEDRTGQGRAGQ